MLTHREVAMLVGRSNATIVEIGANGGQDTCKLAETFSDGLVYAFEPDPRAAARFRKNVRNSNVHFFEMAVGARVGLVNFYQSSGRAPVSDNQRLSEGLPDDWDLSGSIRTPKHHLSAHPWCKFEKSVRVQITTLDTWASGLGLDSIDFIWADVQGAEEDLILGGQQILNRTRWFYSEYSDTEMYEGEINLEKMAALLPQFEILKVFKHDALFMNKNYGV